MVRRVDSVLVVVDENIMSYQRFHLVHRHAVGRNSIEKLLFERGEEALHSHVVVAMRDATETLTQAAVFQLLSKRIAGVLAATVGVQDRAADRETPGSSLERVDAQLLAHVVVHAQGKNLAVEAIHDWRDVKLSVGALDLGHVGQQLSPRPVRAEILMEQVRASSGSLGGVGVHAASRSRASGASAAAVRKGRRAAPAQAAFGARRSCHCRGSHPVSSVARPKEVHPDPVCLCA